MKEYSGEQNFTTSILPCDRVGRNVAAGMTGGLAYILDEDNTLLPKVCAFFLQFFMGYTMRLEACSVDFFYFLFSLLLLVRCHLTSLCVR
jgi:hypothetical protein